MKQVLALAHSSERGRQTPGAAAPGPGELLERAWTVTRALCRGAGAAELLDLDRDGWLGAAMPKLDGSAARGWSAPGPVPPILTELLDLYAPLGGDGGDPKVVAHLGQSIDGFVAGADRKSLALNDPANIVHLHRLRALFDVVLVGRGTACADNPKLTTRLVSGANPVRVVLDPQLRSEPELQLFSDALAPTLLVAASDAPHREYPAGTRVLRLRSDYARVQLREVLELLQAEGLCRVFIEGGGCTVSRALEQGVLSRLHVTVAPLFIGAGVPGLRLAGITRFADALRPACRTFAMGSDVLYDFAL